MKQGFQLRENTQKDPLFEKNIKEKELQVKNDRAQARIKELIKRYLKAEQEGSPTASMLKVFAQLAFRLMEMNKTISDLQVGIMALDDTLGVMDGCMSIIDEVFTRPRQKHGMFHRLKMRMKIRSFSRNIKNQFVEIENRMKMVPEISDYLARTLDKISFSINSQMQKSEAKRQKRALKAKEKMVKKGDGSDVAVASTDTAFENFVNSIKGEMPGGASVKTETPSSYNPGVDPSDVSSIV